MSISPTRPFTGTAATTAANLGLAATTTVASGLDVTPAAAAPSLDPTPFGNDSGYPDGFHQQAAAPIGSFGYPRANGGGIVESVTVPEPARPQPRPLTLHVSLSPAQIQQNLAQRLGAATDDNAVFVNPTLEELLQLMRSREINSTFKYIIVEDGENGQLRLLSSAIALASFHHVNLFDNNSINKLVGAGFLKIGKTKEGAIAIAFDGKSSNFLTTEDDVHVGIHHPAKRVGLGAVQASLEARFPGIKIILVDNVR